MIVLLRDDPLFNEDTVTVLSEYIVTFLFCQKGAQRYAAKETATTSFSLI